MASFSSISELRILRQDYGAFDRRTVIGPLSWPHHDLLWIHSGALLISVGDEQASILDAPFGIWIFPNTRFHGKARTEFVRASITHFETSSGAGCQPGYLLSPAPVAFRIQTMIELSHDYARDGVEETARTRLLRAILDAFTIEPDRQIARSRVDDAWESAMERIAQMRTLADVASQAGISESTFRALHRREKGGSAGEYLQAMRLSHAERLLLTTRMRVSDIAAAVGYAHLESFITAFRRRHGVPPGRHRKVKDPFG